MDGTEREGLRHSRDQRTEVDWQSRFAWVHPDGEEGPGRDVRDGRIGQREYIAVEDSPSYSRCGQLNESLISLLLPRLYLVILFTIELDCVSRKRLINLLAC